MDFGIHGNTPTIPSGTVLSFHKSKLSCPWLVETHWAWFDWPEVKIENQKKNMKLRLKIISRNLFKSDRINYMHIRHKCSSSMTIHSLTGKLRSINRKHRHSENVDNPKKSIRRKSIIREIHLLFTSIDQKIDEILIHRKYRKIEKFIYRKLGLTEIYKIFLVGTKLWRTAKNSAKWLIWVKLFWFPISLSIMLNMMNQCNFEWFQTCSQVANMNAPGNFPTNALAKFRLYAQEIPQLKNFRKFLENFDFRISLE